MKKNKSKYKRVFLSILLLSFVSCSTEPYKDDKQSKTNWKESQIDDLKLLLNEAGMKNVTSNFKQFLFKNDSIDLEEYMFEMGYDSLFLIPGNLPRTYIKDKTNFQLPVLSTPEDNSLIIFKAKGDFVGYAYSSDDTLLLSIKGGNLSYSVKDSTLLVKKRKFENNTIEIIFSNPDSQH
jgi:hypothetical protein